MTDRIILGITGASGAPIAVRLLHQLKKAGKKTYLIISDSGAVTLKHECGLTPDNLFPFCEEILDFRAVGSCCSSGSWKNDGMIIVPASMKTIAGIANGYSDNLITRTADVMLKERRKLVIVSRECPFSLIHLTNMTKLTQAGAVILPAMMSFYEKPVSIDDMVNHLVGKILDQFDIEAAGYTRWDGMI